MEKISIIVPIYNVENYVDKCISSLINQTYHNIEIILIDDGSVDKSGKICDRYKAKDNRIVVIHKTNGGLSDARNAGLCKATGTYITYVDGDDYVATDYIEVLYNNLKFNEADISVATFMYVYENTQNVIDRKSNSETEIWNSEETLRNMLLQRKITTSVCGVLSKRIYWDNVRFPVGKLYEDMATSYKIYFQAQKIIFCNKVIYYYLIRSGSIQNTNFSLAKMDELDYALECREFIKKNYPNLEQASNNRLISCTFHILFSMNDWKENMNIYNQLKKIIYKYRKQMIIGKDVNKKVRFGCLCSYFGLGFTKYVYEKLQMKGRINL